MSEWFGKSSVAEVLVNDKPDFNWYVVRTKSRCEKKLSSDLKFDRVRFYLPIFTKVSLSGRMQVNREIPLFSGYVFTYADYETRFKITDNKYVASMLDVNQVDSFLCELNNIEIALQTSQTIAPIDFHKIGEKVRIIKGPFEGQEGEVLRFKNKFTLILRASLIGLAVTVEINATDAEPITAE